MLIVVLLAACGVAAIIFGGIGIYFIREYWHDKEKVIPELQPILISETRYTIKPWIERQLEDFEMWRKEIIAENTWWRADLDEANNIIDQQIQKYGTFDESMLDYSDDNLYELERW
jgi:hypothetical protein